MGLPRALWVALCLVVATNGLVRLAGGDPHWLSVRHLPEKGSALLRLSLHLAGHAVGLSGSSCSQPAQQVLTRAARAARLSPRLALAVARAESSLDPHAVSRTGAMGLMQLMGATADELGVRDPFEAADNAEGGARYLRRLLARYGGDTRRALWAYNAGPGVIPRSGPITPPRETRAYAHRVHAGL